MFGRKVIRRLGRWSGCAVVLACLGMTGCSNLDLRGESFAPDDTYDSCGSYRRPNDQIEFFGFSNKAREIESHVSAH